MPHDLDTSITTARKGGRKPGQQNRASIINVKTLESIRRSFTRVADNLYLRVKNKRRTWVFRAKYGNDNLRLGLGRYDDMTLDQAKEKAATLRREIANGVDPRLTHHVTPAAQAYTVALAWTDYVTANEAGWRGGKTKQAWLGQYRDYVAPVGQTPIAKLSTADVLAILNPIWATKTVTAEAVRGRLERVWNAAKAKGHCSGDNPARWDGHLSTILPAPHKLHTTENHASLPFEDMPQFMLELRMAEGLAATGVAMVILTGGRSAEVREATWSEIDLEAALWCIPASRMKGGADHAVPLPAPLMTLLRAVPRYPGNDHVFGRPGDGIGFGKNAMLALVNKLRPGITTHGFRSSFMMWGQLVAKAPQIVLDMSLAHKQDDAILGAYLRRTGTTLDEARRRCLEDWAAYCCGAAAPSHGG